MGLKYFQKQIMKNSEKIINNKEFSTNDAIYLHCNIFFIE